MPDKHSAAIAVVAHFEYSDRTEPAKQWTKYFEAFDWTLQDARGANNPAQLRQMQAQYGLTLTLKPKPKPDPNPTPKA